MCCEKVCFGTQQKLGWECVPGGQRGQHSPWGVYGLEHAGGEHSGMAQDTLPS